MADLEWAVKLAKRSFGQEVPVFLMGHSMVRARSCNLIYSHSCLLEKAGGSVLGFATRETAPPEKATVKLLAGVISSSPLIRIGRKDPSSALKFVVRMVSKGFPNMPINTPPQVEVIHRFVILKLALVADDCLQDLSRDPAVGESALKDPWIKSVGTGQSILDMIDRVCMAFS